MRAFLIHVFPSLILNLAQMYHPNIHHKLNAIICHMSYTPDWITGIIKLTTNGVVRMHHMSRDSRLVTRKKNVCKNWYKIPDHIGKTEKKILRKKYAINQKSDRFFDTSAEKVQSVFEKIFTKSNPIINNPVSFRRRWVGIATRIFPQINPEISDIKKSGYIKLFLSFCVRKSGKSAQTLIHTFPTW